MLPMPSPGSPPARRHPGRLLVFASLAAAWIGLGGASRQESTPPAPPRPSHPTGAVLFQDRFADGLLTGWKSDRDSVWHVTRGMLCAELPDERQQHSFLYAGSEDWTDYAVDLDVCMMRGVDKGVIVRAEGEDGIGVDLRGPGYQDLIINHREWPMGRVRAPNANAMWHHLRVEARGNRVRVSLDGSLVLEAVDKKSRRPRGRIALSAYTGGGGECLVYYDNVVVTALPPTSEAAVEPALSDR